MVDRCPECGHETESFYGGERGEGSLFWRCLSDDCSWNEETVRARNYGLAKAMIERLDVVRRRCVDPDYDREIIAAAKAAGLMLTPLASKM